ncbi:hypothetical protein DPMN_125741 [Dreissena polymorpha]|uniref:Uncharacterized protein n=1 Tax=Dreissena polymorpha TaxID=45954 RepID=A0A9D4GYR6_DREPO|nr:hypothetical protein DPMN_125741 [Dreissena polymorpha]
MVKKPLHAPMCLKIDENHQKCLLRYEDRSEYWSLFKDIHRGTVACQHTLFALHF